ncbi:hypothetical protein Droror1_Dr00017931 [Drosera rotundifolia]
MAAGLGKLRCSVADKVVGYFAGAGVEAAGVLVGVLIGVVVRFRFGVWLVVFVFCRFVDEKPGKGSHESDEKPKLNHWPRMLP